MVTFTTIKVSNFGALASASSEIVLNSLPSSTIDNVHKALRVLSSPERIPELESPMISTSDVFTEKDAVFPLDITVTPGDANSEISMITISGVPSGALLSAGIDNGVGSWTLTPDNLIGLKLIPTFNAKVDFDLSIEAFATGPGGGVSTSEDMLSVDFSAGSIKGLEDKGIALSIDAELIEFDGSDRCNIIISGVPTGASLSTGVDNGDGTWTLTADELVGLTFFPPLSHTTYKLGVTAISTETANVFSSFVMVVDRNGFVTFSTPGMDRLYGHQTCFDLINGNDGRDFIYAYGGDDELYNVGRNSRISVSDDSDMGFGCNDRDILFGESGNDFLGGRAGIDFIDGGIGNDAISVGIDTDYLVEQANKEQLFSRAW